MANKTTKTSTVSNHDSIRLIWQACDGNIT
jgi:hypothetical protein